MRPLFVVILAGVVTGIAASSLYLRAQAHHRAVVDGHPAAGSAALLDQSRTSQDRPHDFFLSQFLAAVGSGMFMGPLIMLGITAA